MFEFAAKAFVTLFVLIEPIGLLPLFIGLAGNYSDSEQKRIARKAVVVAGAVIVGFSILGSMALNYLGISIDAFKIAAGLLLFRIALDMINAQFERETSEEAAENVARRDISVFPLAIPLIAGPGTLAGVLILLTAHPGENWVFPVVIATAASVLLITYLFLRGGAKLTRYLGKTGINVVTRVFGILLAALAVQYVIDGIRGFIVSTIGMP